MSKGINLVVADKKGAIFSVQQLAAVGMSGNSFVKLRKKDLVEIPFASSLFKLSDRVAVGFSEQANKFVSCLYNPYSKKKQRCFPVAAFVMPGFTTTYNSAYLEEKNCKPLPLFSYSAVCEIDGKFYVAAKSVTRQRRHDIRFMSQEKILSGIKKISKIFPKNRLVKHLSNCACEFGCPAAKNFFLSRFEAPLPTSSVCNARCLGCISSKEKNQCAGIQKRISFLPTAEEVAEIALYHIENVDDAVVSFGQGCEGDPLFAFEVVACAVKRIRKQSDKGFINFNTNASLPDRISELADCGMDSFRVSINSFQKDFYTRYYRPKKYCFEDVLKSIKIIRRKKKFCAINYLTMPGFTDLNIEFSALRQFLSKTGVDMIQWRNLNFDPLSYLRQMKVLSNTDTLGMAKVISSVKNEFKTVMNGYFNPSKRTVSQWRKRQIS